MEALTKLRTLIWDKDSTKFSDEELTEFMTDCNNNLYRTAAFVLTIILGDPERESQYTRGKVSVTRQDISKAIETYKSMAGDSRITSTLTRRNYHNESTKKQGHTGCYH